MPTPISFVTSSPELETWRADIEARLAKLEAIPGPPSPVPTPTPVQVPVQSDFSKALSRFESNITIRGTLICASRTPEWWYYDGGRVFYQIADYLKDPSWHECAKAAIKDYRDGYLVPNNYAANDHMNFPHGLWMDYEQTGDMASKDAGFGLATNSAFVSSPIEWLMNADGSRPTAYNVEAKLLAQAHGAPVVLLNDQVELMFGHIWQWMNRLLNKPVVQIGKESNGKPVYETYYVRPFMAALTCEAMIQWAGDDMTRIRRVLAAIQPFWDQLWYMCWLPDSKSMMYTNCLTSAFSSDIPGYNTGDQQPSPDLNLLISPVFAWMYKWTGQVGYRDKHDSLFIGGVNQADITQGKQFNQNYRWSIQGLEWRG